MGEYVVELKNITKRFPGVIALKNMSIGIRPGEIHGLIGENGAGKSTLIKVLTGVHSPEEGEIFVDGEKRTFRNPVQSREAGIACVYQELNIVKQLPVTDNVFMGRAVKKGILLDYPRMHREAEEALKSLGHPEIDVRMECGKLGVGQQQMVEIAKAVSLDAKLIIMDEPTSSLGKEEIAQLMATVRGLKAKGVANPNSTQIHFDTTIPARRTLSLPTNNASSFAREMRRFFFTVSSSPYYQVIFHFKSFLFSDFSGFSSGVFSFSHFSDYSDLGPVRSYIEVPLERSPGSMHLTPCNITADTVRSAIANRHGYRPLQSCRSAGRESCPQF